MRTLSNQSPAALAETVASSVPAARLCPSSSTNAILWTKDQPPTTAEVSHTLDGVRRTCGTPFSCLIRRTHLSHRPPERLAFIGVFQNSEANCAVHDFSLNALEIVKSIWDDSVFFSNLNQMSLIKLKLGFDEFLAERRSNYMFWSAKSCLIILAPRQCISEYRLRNLPRQPTHYFGNFAGMIGH
jgi:hypothetical protein